MCEYQCHVLVSYLQFGPYIYFFVNLIPIFLNGAILSFSKLKPNLYFILIFLLKFTFLLNISNFGVELV